jgi:hypothetical protein
MCRISEIQPGEHFWVNGFQVFVPDDPAIIKGETYWGKGQLTWWFIKRKNIVSGRPSIGFGYGQLYQKGLTKSSSISLQAKWKGSTFPSVAVHLLEGCWHYSLLCTQW